MNFAPYLNKFRRHLFDVSNIKVDWQSFGGCSHKQLGLQDPQWKQ